METYLKMSENEKIKFLFSKLKLNFVGCMLAKDFKKESHKVKYPCYVQPKLDGMRALGRDLTPMISRKGKIIDTMEHIQKDLDKLALNGVYLDGELYQHHKSFQENMRLIKKYRRGESENVNYHVYDMIQDKPFEDRYATLALITLDLNNIELVPTYLINNEKELKEYHVQFLKAGYEGTIVRHSNAGYAINKRDTQLLKYKDFIDDTYEVIDVVPSEKDPKKGVVHCTIDGGADNVTFGCGMKFSHAEREEILVNKEKYIGQMAEIRFFEYTEDGLPRFPVCVGFRLDK